MVACDEGIEAQQRYERLLEILVKADQKRLEDILGKKREEEQRLDAQIEEGHRKRFLRFSGSTNKKIQFNAGSQDITGSSSDNLLLDEEEMGEASQEF